MGNQYFTGIFPSNKHSKIPRGNLGMLICNNCKLLQLDENFDSNEYDVQIIFTMANNPAEQVELELMLERLR